MILTDIIFNPDAVDKLAGIITIVGQLVVFVSLAFLVIIFTRIPKIIRFFIKFRVRRRMRVEGKEIPEYQEDISADVNASIALALHLYFSELHDQERHVVTIKKVSKTYSPWSSKIYGIKDGLYPLKRN